VSHGFASREVPWGKKILPFLFIRSTVFLQTKDAFIPDFQ